MRVKGSDLLKTLKSLIAKLASKVKAIASPYFGAKDFAFAPAFA